MVFVTVGSQKIQFDRLIQTVDELIASGVIPKECFAQTGYCTYIPQHMKYAVFLDRDEFALKMSTCDTVITHGGTGAIIGAIKRGKKVIAVPRLARFGEHVDDHQIEIVRQFAEMGLIEPCYDLSKLGDAYERSRKVTYRSYASNTRIFIADLGAYLDSLGEG